MFDKNDNIRLIDFGFSQRFQAEDDMFHSFCGTPAYMPPEIIQKQPYSTKSDIWCLGIILYEMIMGKRPFDHFNTFVLCKKIRELEPNYTGISPPLRNLLESMLKKNPNERISLFQMRSYSSFQETIYYQFLNETLSIIAEKKDEDLIENISTENMKERNCSIMKQILAKEKITDLIRDEKCLNDFIHQQSSIENIQRSQYEKDENKLITIRKNRSSKHFNPTTIQYYPEANLKQYSTQKRHQSTQHVKAKNNFPPFLKFPIPNLRFEEVSND
jgi:serine/threonine protein kinase